MWEVRATYDDGTDLEKYFDANPYKSEADDQHDLEEYAIGFHDGCNWYSVYWIND